MTTLKPFLSVNPLKGFHQNYDALPDGPHGSVYLRTYGGHTEHSKGVGNPGGNDLESQAANDEILLGFDPVDPKHESIENRAGDVLAKNALVFDFRADRVSSSSQFLMLFGLRGIG